MVWQLAFGDEPSLEQVRALIAVDKPEERHRYEDSGQKSSKQSVDDGRVRLVDSPEDRDSFTGSELLSTHRGGVAPLHEEHGMQATSQTPNVASGEICHNMLILQGN